MDRTATRGLLATDHVILSHGQVTWTTPELAPLLLTTTPHQREDVSALDIFNVHRCPTRRVFKGTGLELVTRQATSDTDTTWLPRPPHNEESGCEEFGCYLWDTRYTKARRSNSFAFLIYLHKSIKGKVYELARRRSINQNKNRTKWHSKIKANLLQLLK
ncbi:uncharacterized protein TNCV_2015181 [Trichonephila clavipes]|nr:uncharacterized protein TNCV_2015181 [Trichonephila clavipes]